MEGQRRARLLRRRCARCTSTHARTCSTQRPDQGAKEKKKGGKGVTRRKRKKKGRGQGVQLVRLHWIGTISGRAPPPDALPCTAPASKSGQGGCVVREEERGEMICCVGKAQSKEGEGGEQSTVHQENAQKTAASKRTCFSNAPPHTSNGGSGKRAARERGEGGKVTRVPDCTGRGEGGGKAHSACVWQQR